MRRMITGSLTALLFGGTAFAGSPNFPSALPPTANAGECYGQVKIPAQYSTHAENVVTADGFTDIKVKPAKFKTRVKEFLTKEESTHFVVRQPSFRTVSEQVLTRPGHDRLSVSPPQYSTITESLQTSAPHLVWKRGNPGELQRQGYVIHSTADGRLSDPAHPSGYGGGGSYGTSQSSGEQCGLGCEIWCLVEEPGSSVTTTRRVLTAPPQVIKTPVPPQYRTITKQIVTDPGGVKKVRVPAEYATLEIDKLVRPAKTYHVDVPPVLGQVEGRTLISPERYEWRRVLCQPGTIGQAPQTSRGYQSHGSSVSHGGGYVQGSSHSNVSSYSSGSTYSNVPSYSSGSTHSNGAGYSSGTTFSQGTSVSQPSSHIGSYPTETKTGYYGTEDFPAYQNR